MYKMEHYVSKRRATLVDYVATRPIGELIEGVERPSGSSTNRMFWWDQVVENEEEGGVDI